MGGWSGAVAKPQHHSMQYPDVTSAAAASAINGRGASPPSSSRVHGAPSSSSGAPLKNLALGLLFLSALLLLVVLFRSFPELSPEDQLLLRFPRSMADVRGLSVVLRKYRDENMAVVVAGFCAVYIFLQSFAIPGALFLSILAGPLFGVWRGLFLVSLVATTGSSVCYLVSFYLARGMVERCFPAMLTRLRGMIARRGRGSNLFFYLLFLRISPLLPNWFISLAAPILDIPLRTFALATFVGLMPANYLHVTTGAKLDELDQSTGEGGGAGHPVNVKALAFLFGIAFVALLPTLFKSKFEAALGAGSGSSDAGALDADPSASPSPFVAADPATDNMGLVGDEMVVAPTPSQRQTRSSTKKKKMAAAAAAPVAGAGAKLDKQI